MHIFDFCWCSIRVFHAFKKGSCKRIYRKLVSFVYHNSSGSFLCVCHNGSWRVAPLVEQQRLFKTCQKSAFCSRKICMRMRNDKSSSPRGHDTSHKNLLWNALKWRQTWFIIPAFDNRLLCLDVTNMMKEKKKVLFGKMERHANYVSMPKKGGRHE